MTVRTDLSRAPAFHVGAAFRPEVLLRSGNGTWLLFREPKAVISAHVPSAVTRALCDAGDAAAAGAWVAGFVAYEAAGGLDSALSTRDPGNTPLVWLGVFGPPEEFAGLPLPDGGYRIDEWMPSPERKEYLESAGRVLDYIRAGDTYQVNLSIRLRSRFEGDPFALFVDLWNSQPTPYAAFIRFEDRAVCSVSPELFFESDGSLIRSKPMKGTARRGLWYEDDQERAEALRRSPKDRAENVMIVDMIRNDIGRIAAPGTVRVTRLFDVERHPSVFQMTSTVEAQSGSGLAGAFGALFPCASITGAPKVRTMQIIRELERSPRGIYCGAIGMAHGRTMRFNVGIRTVVLDTARGMAEYGAGGGVVSDSVPEAEFEECEAKAGVLTARVPDFKLLETIRWSGDEGFFLIDRHLGRLADSAVYFGFRFDRERTLAALRSVEGECGGEPRRVRLLLASDGTVSVETSPMPHSGDKPVRVALATEAVDVNDRFLYHKTTCRAFYERARAQRPGLDDVILFNALGEVTESTTANVVVDLGGRLVTPPVRCGLLPGTLRGQLIEDCAVAEGAVPVSGLGRTGCIWLVNSLRGWRRAELVLG